MHSWFKTHKDMFALLFLASPNWSPFLQAHWTLVRNSAPSFRRRSSLMDPMVAGRWAMVDAIGMSTWLLMWGWQCHRPPMTGNVEHSNYLWWLGGWWWHCFTHIITISDPLRYWVAPCCTQLYKIWLLRRSFWISRWPFTSRTMVTLVDDSWLH